MFLKIPRPRRCALKAKSTFAFVYILPIEMCTTVLQHVRKWTKQNTCKNVQRKTLIWVIIKNLQCTFVFGNTIDVRWAMYHKVQIMQSTQVRSDSYTNSSYFSIWTIYFATSLFCRINLFLLLNKGIFCILKVVCNGGGLVYLLFSRKSKLFYIKHTWEHITTL